MAQTEDEKKATESAVAVLRTKLIPPRLSDTVERERFHPFFDEILEKKAVAITAGAGFGKTTLIAQACARLNIDTVWYRLDESDGDFAVFIRYLVEGIRRHIPDFGTKTIGRSTEAGMTRLERKDILTGFLSEVETKVPGELLIVLDDFHLIDSSPWISEAMAFLTESSAGNLHFAILSRTEPGFGLPKLISRRAALRIGEEELSFSRGEIENLYKEVFGIALGEKSLAALREKTDGWVSGLVLLRDALENKSEAEMQKSLLAAGGGAKLFYDYLDENVFVRLNDETSRFLIETSILSRLDVRFCDRLLCIDNSREILEETQRRHLFTFPFDETRDIYYSHHLFRDFLKKKLKRERGPEFVEELHRRAAELYFSEGDEEAAIRHFLEAKAFEKACRMLGRFGRDLIHGGRIRTFMDLYERLPKKVAEKEPLLQYSLGRAMELSGKISDALEIFKNVINTPSTGNWPKARGVSFVRLASLYYVIGDFHEAEKSLKAMLDEAGDSSRLHIDILGHLIFTSCFLGKLRQADRFYDEAIDRLSAFKNHDLRAWILFNYGWRFFLEGDFSRGESFGQKADALCRRFDLRRLYQQIHHLLSILSYFRGDYQRGCDLALEGLEAKEEIGYVQLSHAWLLVDACLCLSGIGDLKAAKDYGLRGLEMSRRIQSSWTESWANHALRRVYLKEGNLGESETSARASLDCIRGFNLRLHEGVMKSGIAETLLETGKIEEAGELLAEAEGLLGWSKYNLFQVYIRQTDRFLRKNLRKPALDRLRAALVLSREYRYDHKFMEAGDWIIPLMAELLPDPELNLHLSDLFRKIGTGALETLRKLSKYEKSEAAKAALPVIEQLEKLPAPGLRIFCLGPFRVYRGDHEIGAEQWPGEKATTLFRIFAARRSEGFIPSEMLMETLWPEEDPEKSRNRLRVALTTLRRTLEPDLRRGTASSYIEKRGDAYRLKLREGGRLDAEDFEREVRLSKIETDEKKAVDHCLAAHALYGGDLFAEYPYEHWCQEPRDHLRESFFSVSRRLMAYFRESAPEKCMRIARRHLRHDPYAEDVYLLLMKLYLEKGNRSMAVKTCEQCREKIENDLGLPLGDEIVEFSEKRLGR